MAKEIECDNCGSVMERYPSLIHDTNFCSNDCKHEYQTGKQPWVKHEELEDPEWIRKRHHDRGMTYGEIADELGCSQQNVHKRAKEHGIKPQRERYTELADVERLKELNHDEDLMLHEIANLIGCTRSAVGYALRRNGIDPKRHLPKGEENHFWKGGDYENDYGPNWQSIRDEIRERDDYECQDCGVDEGDLNMELHIHHITPRRKFDDIERANRRNNLIALCASCHRKWEGIPLKPDNRGIAQ